MTRIKYDIVLIKCISLFETLTQAKVKDCFIDDRGILTFIVSEHEIGKAIGRGGEMVRRLERSLNRKIKIVEFNPDLLQFVRNLIYPLQARHIEQVDSVVQIEPKDMITRGHLIGRAAVNLRNYVKITKRMFPIEEIKIV